MTQQRTVEERLQDLESDRSRLDTRIDTVQSEADAAVSRVAELRSDLRRGKVRGVQPAFTDEEMREIRWFLKERKKVAR